LINLRKTAVETEIVTVTATESRVIKLRRTKNNEEVRFIDIVAAAFGLMR
jgi:hypothetical protein